MYRSPGYLVGPKIFCFSVVSPTGILIGVQMKMTSTIESYILGDFCNISLSYLPIFVSFYRCRNQELLFLMVFKHLV